MVDVVSVPEVEAALPVPRLVGVEDPLLGHGLWREEVGQLGQVDPVPQGLLQLGSGRQLLLLVVVEAGAHPVLGLLQVTEVLVGHAPGPLLVHGVAALGRRQLGGDGRGQRPGGGRGHGLRGHLFGGRAGAQK